jgi:hypothetical protein
MTNLTVLIPPIKPPLTRADAQADLIACGIKPRERIVREPLPSLESRPNPFPRRCDEDVA